MKISKNRLVELIKEELNEVFKGVSKSDLVRIGISGMDDYRRQKRLERLAFNLQIERELEDLRIAQLKEGYDKDIVKSIFKGLNHDEAKDIIDHLQSGRIEEAVENFYKLNKGM